MANANHPFAEDPPSPKEIAHGALRGVIAAMAMTGMRSVTVGLGLVRETPPTAIVRQRARRLSHKLPRKRRRASTELFHWSYGAVGGMMFAMLPARIRHAPWGGPAYGLAIWVGFEAGIAPVLGLDQAKRQRSVERMVFAVDHVLYGFVLSETRRRPRG